METYRGHVKTPSDAIILFEACRIGLLPRVQRRLSEKERQQIRSGSVFVWDEREAGMRRWTDGKSWSASRVSGSFLTYREMEGKRGGNGLTPPAPTKSKASSRSSEGGSTKGDSDEDGPDGYRYKPDGLMKQSFSITTQNGQHLHLISYYARSSPTATDLQQPSTDASLRHIRPPKNMYPESSVNESTSTPPVTRGPMGGSPYAQAVHAVPSPYQRAAIPAGYVVSSWPPTPSSTPPAIYYHPHMHPHSPMPYYIQGYPPPGYPPPPPGYDPRAHGALPAPPPGHHMQNGHVMPSPYMQHAPHHHTSPPHPHHREPGQPGPGQLPPAHYRDQRNSAPGVLPTTEATTTSGPTLPPFAGTAPPALNGVNGVNGSSENKQPSPRVAEARPVNGEATLQLPDNNVANAPSPARIVPSVGSLLNAHPTEDSKSDRSGSRPGSRSPPTTAPRHLQDIPHTKIGQTSGADIQALRKLDSTFIHKNVHVSS